MTWPTGCASRTGCPRRDVEKAHEQAEGGDLRRAAAHFPDGPQYVHYVNNERHRPAWFGQGPGEGWTSGRATAARAPSSTASSRARASRRRTASSEVYLQHRVPFDQARAAKFNEMGPRTMLQWMLSAVGLAPPPPPSGGPMTREAAQRAGALVRAPPGRRAEPGPQRRGLRRPRRGRCAALLRVPRGHGQRWSAARSCTASRSRPSRASSRASRPRRGGHGHRRRHRGLRAGEPRPLPEPRLYPGARWARPSPRT